jgi:heptosyltransferase-2
VQLDHLGDAMFTTAMLPALKARYPQAEIEVLASPAAADVFRGRADVNRVWIYRRYRFVRDGGWGWPASVLLWGLRLRRRRYDLAFDCRGEMPIALLMWLAGAKRRVGWAAGGGGFLLTDSVEFIPGRHEVESRRAMLAQLKIAGGTEPALEPSRQAMQSVAQRLAKISGANEKLYVLHIGAGTQAKRWPVVHWRELVRRLRLEHHGRVVLVGALAERGLARRITRLAASPKVVDWTGRTTVLELAALARMADLFIGADSGPAHVAAAAGVPTVVLFSGTNQAEQWTPRGPRVYVVRRPVACSPCHREVCPLADHPCMQDLRPIEVLHTVERALTSAPVPVAA